MAEAKRDLGTKLANAVDNWLVLDVVTRVGEVDPSLPVSAAPSGGKSMRTRIRVLEGDIIFESDPDFVNGGPYASLVAEHEKRVEKGEEILKRTVDTIVSLAEKVESLLK
jgi:hypothetical protein